jgi:hypothetical protein
MEVSKKMEVSTGQRAQLVLPLSSNENPAQITRRAGIARKSEFDPSMGPNGILERASDGNLR